MKKKCISIISTIILTLSIAVMLSSCDEYVEGTSVSVGDMSIELPDGEWRLNSDTDYDNEVIVYNDNIGTIYLCEKDGDTYYYTGGNGLNDSVMFEEEPSVTDSYIDGYRTEFDISENESHVAIKGYGGNYYFLKFTPDDDFYNAESVGIQLLKSISFEYDAPLDYDSNDNEYIISWEQANNMAKDMAADGVKESQEEYFVKGEIKKITTSDGNIFVDIGRAYPNENRVTGVIWKEYVNNFAYSTLCEGKTVYLWGKIYPYNGCANIRLEQDSHVIELIDIDSIDDDFMY